MIACPAHKWRHAGCDDCDRLNVRFDPSTNLTLQALRSAWKEGPDERDQADWITHAIDSEGTVKVRPLTLTDIFDYVERECRGDVA